jgi:hypothetical protein
MSESVVKARALNWLSEVLTFMNILLLKRKDILRVNSFCVLIISVRVNAEAVNAKAKQFHS